MLPRIGLPHITKVTCKTEFCCFTSRRKNGDYTNLIRIWTLSMQDFILFWDKIHPYISVYYNFYLLSVLSLSIEIS